MARNIRHGSGEDRNAATNKATIFSVNAQVTPNTVRVSIQWEGDHDISDFELQRFGKALNIQSETKNTGWATFVRFVNDSGELYTGQRISGPRSPARSASRACASPSILCRTATAPSCSHLTRNAS
jgi:hypothetical protein